MRRLIALVATLAITEPARADWVELGVAAQCNQDGMTFHVLPIVTTNIVAHNIRAPSGAHVFLSGSDQIYRCKLGRSSIELRLDVSPPQERGMGQGTGTVTISGLTVNETRSSHLLPTSTGKLRRPSRSSPELCSRGRLPGLHPRSATAEDGTGSIPIQESAARKPDGVLMTSSGRTYFIGRRSSRAPRLPMTGIEIRPIAAARLL